MFVLQIKKLFDFTKSNQKEKWIKNLKKLKYLILTLIFTHVIQPPFKCFGMAYSVQDAHLHFDIQVENLRNFEHKKVFIQKF